MIGSYWHIESHSRIEDVRETGWEELITAVMMLVKARFLCAHLENGLRLADAVPAPAPT